MIIITMLKNLEESFKIMEGTPGVSQINIFGKNTENIAIPIANKLLEIASREQKSVHIQAYNTKEELLFKLGSKLNHKDEYILLGEELNLPDEITSEYNIVKKPGCTTKTRGRKPRKVVTPEKDDKALPVSTPDKQANTLTEIQTKENSKASRKATKEDKTKIDACVIGDTIKGSSKPFPSKSKAKEENIIKDNEGDNEKYKESPKEKVKENTDVKLPGCESKRGVEQPKEGNTANKEESLMEKLEKYKAKEITINLLAHHIEKEPEELKKIAYCLHTSKDEKEFKKVCEKIFDIATAEEIESIVNNKFILLKNFTV